MTRRAQLLAVFVAVIATSVPIATAAAATPGAAPNPKDAAATWAYYNRLLNAPANPTPADTSAVHAYYNQLFNSPAAVAPATTADTWAHYNRLLNPPAGPASSASPIVVALTNNGFNWGDAGIGAAAGLGLAILSTALLLLSRGSRRSWPAH